MLAAAVKDLKASGITSGEAKAAEMFSVKDASAIHPDFKPWPALLIPYVNPWTDDYIEYEKDGEAHQFTRVRYYPPKQTAQSFTKKKLLRYSQPLDSGVHPYFPVVSEIDWLGIAEDTDIPIMITEGEKKALSACLAGIPTIGLGGVYNFSQDGDLLPLLDNINWGGRTVYICYDSDAANNNKIQAAEGRLATELSMKRNANVMLVRLPEIQGVGKVGVDDYIVHRGDEELWALLNKAPEMRKIDKEIMHMNASVAWIAKEGLMLDLGTDTWMKKADFTKGSEYSAVTITAPAPKGEGLVTVSVANAWLTHPHARRYTDTIFKPGTDDKAIPLPGGGVAYNRFRGLRAVEASEADVAPFFDLYDWIMSRTDEFDIDLLWMTIAYKVQNWETNIGLGLMLLGAQGGGKTMFGKILAEMVKPYDTVIGTDMLSSDYNGWVETSLMVVMNEAETNKMKHCMAKLRTYVTDKTQPMNEKYRANRQVEMNAFMIFNSNEHSAGAFPDDDRRMIVIGCPGTHPDGDEFYGPIWEWWSDDGPAKLLYFFQNYDLEGWTPPRHAPQTREKRMAYISSLTPIQKLGNHMKRANMNVIVQWITTSMEWATSEQVSPSQVGMALEIQQTLAEMPIRPFYTPEELSLMFPAIAGSLTLGKIREAAPVNVLSQELIQIGIDYLRCADNLDGFKHKGQTRQYLIISGGKEFEKPISQKKFDKLMKEYPTYKEYRMLLRQAAKRKRKRKRES